jgi:cyclase
MADWANYSTGLHRVSQNCYAYLQPDGGWGLNNAGVVISEGKSLVIDALMDIPRTRRMLDEIKDDTGVTKIDMLLLTHWHIDHMASACVFDDMGAKIIASRICADYMDFHDQPEWVAREKKMTGDARKAMDHNLGGKFDLSGIKRAVPNVVFDGNRYDFNVGDIKVEVYENKPSHTRSDSFAFMPSESVVHTGDLITAHRHLGLQFPFLTNAIDAMELLKKLDARVYIAGHGPLLVKSDILERIQYLKDLQGSLRKSFDKGAEYPQGAEEFLRNLGPYKNYANPASIYDTARMIYCEFRGDTEDFARKDNVKFTAQSLTRRKELATKMPELFLRF